MCPSGVLEDVDGVDGMSSVNLWPVPCCIQSLCSYTMCEILEISVPKCRQHLAIMA